MSERAQTIPSHESKDHGHQGMIDAPAVCTLAGAQPWVMIANSGAHRVVVEKSTSQQQHDSEIIYNAAKGVYNSQQNVKKAFIDALNIAVPQMYRRSRPSIWDHGNTAPRMTSGILWKI